MNAYFKEHTCIDQKSGGTKRMLHADENRFIPELGRLAATIKEGSALAGCQINYLGRYAQAEPPLAPSDFASPLCQHSHAMTEEDIQRVITQYAAAENEIIICNNCNACKFRLMKDELMTCILWEKEKRDSRNVNKSSAHE